MSAARSSWLVLLACAGCDSVFGLTQDPAPCTPESFGAVKPQVVTEGDQFSVDWDQKLAVLSKDGQTYEMKLPAGEPVPIDLGVYVDLGLALAPEGDALFYTAAIEPIVLRGALRTGTASWSLDAQVPRGSLAGTPSADAYGPRHVLVRLRELDPDVVEYEDVDGAWAAIGDPHAIAGTFAPNMTANGFTMVYAGSDADGQPGIFAASRTTRDTWFGEPKLILSGAFDQPQLLGRCKNLYVTDGTSVLRFDR